MVGYGSPSIRADDERGAGSPAGEILPEGQVATPFTAWTGITRIRKGRFNVLFVMLYGRYVGQRLFGTKFPYHVAYEIEPADDQWKYPGAAIPLFDP